MNRPVDHPGYGHEELITAKLMIHRHQLWAMGLCQCLRRWPCRVNEAYSRHARYWEERLRWEDALQAPTVQLPAITDIPRMRRGT